MRERILAGVVIMVAIGILGGLIWFLYTQSLGGPSFQGKEEKPAFSMNFTLQDVENLHLRMNPKDMETLKKITLNHPDSLVRERAILGLMDIAQRNNHSQEVLEFLKNIAENEKDEGVRSTAYAAIDLLREKNPLELGSLDVRIEGDVKPGKNFTLIVEIRMKKEARGLVGIKMLGEFGSDDPGIELLSRNPVKFEGKAGETRTSKFILQVKRKSKYLIWVATKLESGKTDYQILEKRVYLLL